ncbi:hypothetical protein HDE_03731 [Halotydeus destructor]|nr:hypothetical protein HDE_03731 [Halotydeus destructor]
MTEIRSPVSEAEWVEYYDSRFKHLYEAWGQTKGVERQDDDHISVHAAMYDEDNQLIGIARLNETDQFTPGRMVGRARFVAVHPDHKRKGIGRMLMTYLEQEAIKKKLFWKLKTLLSSSTIA